MKIAAADGEDGMRVRVTLRIVCKRRQGESMEREEEERERDREEIRRCMMS
jgi:hypothetical protein